MMRYKDSWMGRPYNEGSVKVWCVEARYEISAMGQLIFATLNESKELVSCLLLRAEAAKHA